MSNTVVVATFTNADAGLEARIGVYHKGGFSVALLDTDADMFVPGAKVFADYDKAVDFAKKAAGL